jgi:hypothetical protein
MAFRRESSILISSTTAKNLVNRFVYEVFVSVKSPSRGWMRLVPQILREASFLNRF